MQRTGRKKTTRICPVLLQAPPSLLLCCCLALSVYLVQSDFSTGSRLTTSSPNSQIFLKVLAIPAIPLTMSAGLLFGTLYGTMLVSISGMLAATVSFLIARYLAQDRILAMVKDNKKFLAIDKVIGEDGFRVVTLLRLRPLLPFSIGNYLYGLTSVKLLPYILGSWLGMLPGTWAYVSAGATRRAFIAPEAIFPGSPEQYWTVGIGLVATVVAASYVSRLAKDAIKEIE